MFFIICLFPGNCHSEPDTELITEFNLKSFIVKVRLYNAANHFPMLSVMGDNREHILLSPCRKRDFIFLFQNLSASRKWTLCGCICTATSMASKCFLLQTDLGQTTLKRNQVA